MQAIWFVVFFASGFAALMYQVIWQRILAIFSGADIYSATIIVAAFMAGLGIGSLTGGHLADRVSRRTSLVLFGVAEAAIAAFGIFSATLYYDVLYLRLGHLPLAPPQLTAILFLSLLVPTFFMGASLPLLAHALTRSIERAASTIGMLYGVNTLGAATGAFVATWWLLPRLGLDGSLNVGVTLNAACALVVLPFAFLALPAAAEDPSIAAPAHAEHGAHGERRLPLGVWIAIYAVSGFVALSLEIVWFRTLGVMMKSTAFTFGTLLTIYLGGLGVGSLVGTVLARRSGRPASVFLGLQAAAGLCATGLLIAFIAIIDDTRSLRAYFGSYEPISVSESVDNLRAHVASLLGDSPPPDGVPANFLRLYVLVPLVLVAPPTFLLGCSFPILQRVVQTDLALVGRRLGLLLVANIVGSVLGTLLTGWLLLNVVGTPATFQILAGMSTLFAGLAVYVSTIRQREASPSVPTLAATSAALVAALTLTLTLMPGAASFWAALHGTTPDMMFFGEDGSGLSVVKAEKAGSIGNHAVFVNGLGQSTLPYGGIHTALGAVPAFLHPAPVEVAVIGLGSGDTVYAVAGRTDIRHIVCVEIVRPQLDTLGRLGRSWAYAGLQSLLTDPRIEHIFGDGRIHLMRGGRTYDIIEADALRPGSAYAGNLYSEQYFRLVRSRLKPNGLAATWVPTMRVLNTFIRVFPYVVSLPGILVGSDSPIDFDRAAINARLADPRVQRHYDAGGIDINRFLNEYLTTPTFYGPDFDRDTLIDFNTDLFPRDEYDLTFSRR